MSEADGASDLVRKYTLASGSPNCDCGYKRKEDSNMIKTTMKIDGMMCGMCEAHVCDAIRKAVPEAKKVAASRSRKEASFLSEADVDADSLKAAIDATGYTCLGIESSPYEQKGLFGGR
jgi:copper chaperone CopZ